MPIQELIQACHDRGVQVVIDGAHAPGQVQLNLEQLGADYYVGNLYKWLFAPRPSAFLWVNQKHYKTVKPLVTSHNYQQSLQNQFYQQGACDNSQYFSSEAAIQFYQDIGGYETVSQYNREMIEWAMEMLAEAWQTECLPIPGDMRAPFMGMVALPEGCIINVPTTVPRDYTDKLKVEIHNKYKISIVLGYIQDRFWCRLCSHVYNSKEDYFNVRDAFLDMKMENSKIS
ncbi:uncharacterized protein [Ptychodera flava]|uniref:uncharacterized protein isoform X1 n=1 Tax=Ptychodera flava TaxID=63121 RepID=UPI00396A3144